MTINKALQWGIEQLSKANVDSPELDVELLLTYALGSCSPANVKGNDISRNSAIAPFREGGWRSVDRAWLYAHQEQKLINPQLKAYQLFIKRRVQREPVAYILGHKEFYGLDFEVNKNVLIPRPETEILIEQALNEIKNARPNFRYAKTSVGQAKCKIQNVIVVDVGTGSGAIIVSLAKQLNSQFFAIDNSLAALKVARKNARKHGVADRIKFLRGNLLEPIIHNFAIAQSRDIIIVANLPYGFTSEYKKLQPEITKYEPRVAVDGGSDGLKYYREMFKQLEFTVHSSQFAVIVLCEIDPRQTISFKKLARRYFPKAQFKIIKDLAGKNRLVLFCV